MLASFQLAPRDYIKLHVEARAYLCHELLLPESSRYYFCCYTMTSVGYGDNGPKNVLERVACTWIVLASGPATGPCRMSLCLGSRRPWSQSRPPKAAG